MKELVCRDKGVRVVRRITQHHGPAALLGKPLRCLTAGPAVCRVGSILRDFLKHAFYNFPENGIETCSRKSKKVFRLIYLIPSSGIFEINILNFS